ASVLKEAIKRRKPDFSESYYGFRSFGGLLEEMQARGFLKMGRDEKSNAFVFRSGGTDSASSNGAEPAAALPEVLPVTHRVGESEAREPRSRGTRSRGGRGNTAKRHDFEPTLAVEPPAQAALAYADEEDDDAAERFADAARASQAERTVNPPSEPAPDADTYVVDEAGGDAATPRDAGSRRGNRGGRNGRGNAARKNATQAPAPEHAAEAPSPAAAPVPVPAPPPVAEPAGSPAPAPAAKTPRARKTAATKTAAAEKKPAAKKTAARPARKKTPSQEA
ncbi:MAG: hypothetical protein ACJ8GJ_14915, partial [Vitreoscilla sp.]